MDQLSSSQLRSGQDFCSFATSLEHLRLTKKDASSIRAFLRDYDQYVFEASKNARQLIGENIASADIVRKVRLNYCVDAQRLQSSIDVKFIADVDSYGSLENESRRAYLENKATESKDVVTPDILERSG